MKRRIISVKQRESNDCGVACLASIAAHYGLRLPLPKLHHLAGTGRTGTTVLGLIQAATSVGFVAKGVRASYPALVDLAKPLIAHVLMSGQQHFVAVYEATPNHVVYMDPQHGAVHRVTPEQFESSWQGVLIILAPGVGFTSRDETVSSITRIRGLAREHASALVTAAFGTLMTTLFGLAGIIYLRVVIDRVLPPRNHALLMELSLGMLVVIVCQLALSVSQRLLLQRVARSIDNNLILGYYTHLLRLPYRFFAGRRVGDSISRINDAVRIRQFVSSTLVNVALNASLVLAALGLMLVFSWRLALLLAVLLPVYALVYAIADRINRHNQRTLMEAGADLQAWLVESLDGIASIKHFGLEGFASLQTERRLERLMNSVNRSERVSIAADGASATLSRIAAVIALWAGGVMVMNRLVTTGELLSLYALVGFLSGPVGALVNVSGETRDALIAADRLFEVLDLPDERTGVVESEIRQVELEAELTGDVVFDDVSFRYGAGPIVLRHLSFTIPAEKITAVVGASGSGKSTIVALLHKLESGYEGNIQIGRANLADVAVDTVRRRIGVVPQKVEIFSGTVFSNIALGDANPDIDRVKSLSHRVGIAKFVEAMPQQFNSPLGEHGITLSGGQRQRIAIARALYREPSLLILDEGTSSLDTASERQIQNTLAEVLEEKAKTIIIIAHRLSTVVNADKIVVFEHGSVVESGTHAELLSKRAFYYRLWMEQFSVTIGLPQLETHEIST
jgi:ABC-type bacteriocin transporter